MMINWGFFRFVFIFFKPNDDGVWKAREEPSIERAGALQLINQSRVLQHCEVHSNKKKEFIYYNKNESQYNIMEYNYKTRADSFFCVSRKETNERDNQ